MFGSRNKRGKSQGHADLATALASAVGPTQATIRFTRDGNILHANENFLGTMGYALDQVVGQHHSMFVTPD